MKIWSGVIAFVMTALGSMGASAQNLDAAPGQTIAVAPMPHSLDPRTARKATCERDARLVYRVGRNVADDNWQQKIKDSRRAYVQDCMAKAGFTP